jgi:predicted transposase/invertase (TIGR01784 family)
MYETHLSCQTGKDVVTYVVYSNNIKNIKDSLETGINTFRVNAIYMVDKDSEEVFNLINEKISKGIELIGNDIISLSFTPIMAGQTSKLDRIIKTIRISKNIDKAYRHDVESITFAFANKFLTGKDLEIVKEELRMTELGKSLWNDGREDGIEEGKKEIVMNMAKNGLKDEMIATMTGLSIEEVEKLKGEIKNDRIR